MRGVNIFFWLLPLGDLFVLIILLESDGILCNAPSLWPRSSLVCVLSGFDKDNSLQLCLFIFSFPRSRISPGQCKGASSPSSLPSQRLCSYCLIWCSLAVYMLAESSGSVSLFKVKLPFTSIVPGFFFFFGGVGAFKFLSVNYL